MSGHTPGPWTLAESRHIETTSGTFYLTYGSVPKTGAPLFRNFSELDENARLIAAAPDLLEALLHLKRYVDVLKQQWEEDGRPLDNKLHGLAVCLNNRSGDMIDAAIAKATG